MAKPTVKEIRDKIAARKQARKTEKTQKYAKMRLVAAKAPEKLEKHLIRLADKFASSAEGIENLRENLGLVRPAKGAALKVRLAGRQEVRHGIPSDRRREPREDGRRFDRSLSGIERHRTGHRDSRPADGR